MSTSTEPRPTISACILARNEEANLPDAIRSLQGWTDQIIVLDNESTDQTAQVAANLGALVVPPSPADGANFDGLRNLAIEHATGDWLFFLDADERVPPQLGPILQQLIAQQGDTFEGLRLPFKHYVCGKGMQ
jgi:(heptosyl)LPS beta-1,4-glucosyltransferase